MPKKLLKILDGHTRPQNDRICRIISIIKEGKYPNRTTLAAKLEVRPRTIQRDLDLLRDQRNLPIEFDPHKRGYYFTEPVEDLPLVQITEGEIFSLFIAQKAIERFQGTPFEQPLKSAFRKIANSLTEMRSVSWSDLNTGFSFRGVNTLPLDVEIFKKLSKAIRLRIEIGFDYKKIGADAFETRLVHPYHLACISGNWYLYCFDLKRKAIRSFVLTRMKNLQMFSTRFKRKNFNINEELKNSFSAYSGPREDLVMIRIHFDSWASQYIRERKWHESQKLTELAGNELEMSLHLNSTVEILPWILSWGYHAQVLQPVSLITELKTVILKSLAGYTETVGKLPTNCYEEN